jgi:hypothetical protein
VVDPGLVLRPWIAKVSGVPRPRSPWWIRIHQQGLGLRPRVGPDLRPALRSHFLVIVAR